jgi:hypothetical protein
MITVKAKLKLHKGTQIYESTVESPLLWITLSQAPRNDSEARRREKFFLNYFSWAKFFK